MNEPIDLKEKRDEIRQKKPEFVWEHRCGSQLFYLNHDGTIDCRACGEQAQSIEWHEMGACAKRPKSTGGP